MTSSIFTPMSALDPEVERRQIDAALARSSGSVRLVGYSKGVDLNAGTDVDIATIAIIAGITSWFPMWVVITNLSQVNNNFVAELRTAANGGGSLISSSSGITVNYVGLTSVIAALGNLAGAPNGFQGGGQSPLGTGNIFLRLRFPEGQPCIGDCYVLGLDLTGVV